MFKVKVFIFLLIFAFPCLGNAQVVNFQSEQDFLLAQLPNDKLRFVDLYAHWCAPCRNMQKNVFTDTTLAAYINANFDAYKIISDSALGKSLVRKYQIVEYPTYLFLSANNELVYKITGYHSVAKFKIEIDKALKAFQFFQPLAVLENKYKDGHRESAFLQTYLQRKRQEGGRQPELLEEYLSQISKSEYQTEKVLKLISENCSDVNSQAFHILAEALSRFPKLTDTQQKAIIEGISAAKKATLLKAIQHKNDELFETLVRAVYQTSYSQTAALAEERQLRYDYAKHTQNFKFFKVIAETEAQHILSKTIKEYDLATELSINEFKESAEKKGIEPGSIAYQEMLKRLEKGARKLAAFQLNDFARGYFLMAIDESEYKLALKWSAYAIKLESTAANWETYGMLLNKIGRRKDARKALSEAFKLGKNEQTAIVNKKEYLKSKLI